MTHLQAKRIADLTQGYNPTADFSTVVDIDNCVFITVYNLVYRIDPDGHGVLSSTTDATKVIDRF